MAASSLARLRLPTGLALALLAVASTATAQPPFRYRQIGDTPGFPGLRQELHRIADNKRTGRPATFCVMLADRGDGDPLAFAIWRERHLLYRWPQTKGSQIGDEALVLHVPLDLRKDVARTQAEHASTYLVTRAWVRGVERACREHGETVRVGGSAS